jgi:glycosyltransferase involved in cell wall biosynthesis
MSYSLPIITTKVGCLEEMIIEGINGYFVPLKSPKFIAKGIYDLLINVDLAKTMGNNNRIKYEAKYVFDKFEYNMLNVFQNVLNIG